MITVGAHAIGVATHATPAFQNEAFTEAYLTQPAVMAHAALGPLSFSGMLNFEGLTLRRGELNAGVWGEGYIDRRHPHTYLHEAVLTAESEVLGGRFSISAGKGFAPFGSDDPMVRHFVKYPANHHLSQVLERLMVVGAVRSGPLILEAGLFNGDEPASPSDNGNPDNFGDSWSVRGTLVPIAGVELQASLTEITSPENARGGGLDHNAWHASARVEWPLRQFDVYGLIELGRAGELADGVEIFHFDNFLAEAAAMHGGYKLALRVERSDRPEEERLVAGFPFRTVRPAPDNNVLGTTEWTTLSAQVARRLRVGPFELEPLLEISTQKARANELPAIIDPAALYGSDRLWSFSFGVRSNIGPWHSRMGRYGAARLTPAHHDNH